MRIRIATPEDAPAVARIHVASWQAAYRGLMPQDYLDTLSVEARETMWQRAFADPGIATNLVALNPLGHVQGFCVFGPARDADLAIHPIGELVAIYVHPAHGSQGTGTALLAQVLGHAHQTGWEQLALWVLHDNLPARRFYEREGFRSDGADKRSSALTGHELHEVRYRKIVGH